MQYSVKFSKRKSLQLVIDRQAQIIVRAPIGTSMKRVERFVREHEDWIAKHLELQKKRMAQHPEPTEEEKQRLIRCAKEYLPKKTMEYAAIMGVKPSGVKITSARTRFGSCSGKNSICYSWRLMQYPQAAVDYVVVHELAHILHKNHSREFYRTVERFLPDYRQRRALLKQ